MKHQLTGVSVPPSTPRVQLVVRIIDGAPLLFTSDGKYIEGQRDLDVHAPLDDILSVTAKMLVGAIEQGLP